MKAGQVYQNKQTGEQVVIMSVRKYTASEYRKEVRGMDNGRRVVYFPVEFVGKRRIPVDHCEEYSFENHYDLVQEAAQ
jgi:hypothetical protein